MKITRDVITDLLPLYASGEASTDTRSLIEEYLRTDPEFAATVKAASEDRADAIFTPTSDQPADAPSCNQFRQDRHERTALERSRMLLRRRSWTMGLAFFFTLVPFTFGEIDGVSFWLIRDEPGSALFLPAAAWLWFHYYQLQRRLRGTGL